MPSVCVDSNVNELDEFAASVGASAAQLNGSVNATDIESPLVGTAGKNPIDCDSPSRGAIRSAQTNVS